MKKFSLILVAAVSAFVGALVTAVVFDTFYSGKNQPPPVTAAVPEPSPPEPVLEQPKAAWLEGDPRVGALIENLGDPELDNQQQAELELLKIGKPAEPQLDLAVVKHPEEDVRSRCQKILKQINENSQQQASANPNDPKPQEGPRLAAGPTDRELERLRWSLMMQGAVLQEEGSRRIIDPENAPREMLVELWEQKHPNRKAIEGLPQLPSANEMYLDLTATIGAKLIEVPDGFRVAEVRRGSSSANAGLRTGDVVTKINSRFVKTRDEVKDALGKTESGKLIQFRVTRRNEELTIAVPQR